MHHNIKIVNRHHKVPFDVYIGRGSKWGNPFGHRQAEGVKVLANSREEAIQMYEMWIRIQKHLMDSLKELDGRTLGCSCLPLPCHGNVLVKLRNEQLEETNHD